MADILSQKQGGNQYVYASIVCWRLVQWCWIYHECVLDGPPFTKGAALSSRCVATRMVYLDVSLTREVHSKGGSPIYLRSLRVESRGYSRGFIGIRGSSCGLQWSLGARQKHRMGGVMCIGVGRHLFQEISIYALQITLRSQSNAGSSM